MAIFNGTLHSVKRHMHAAELIIIYLAYGAPFGVYEVTSIRRRLSLADIHKVAAKFIFWPVVVALWIRNWFLDGQERSGSDLEREIDIIRNYLELAAFGGRSPVAILQFREAFTRYTGLTLMLMRSKPSLDGHPLIELESREKSRAAAACFYRRRHQKLAFHQFRARKEFIEMIRLISPSQPDHEEVLSNSIQLAILLNDPNCAQYLNGLLPDDREKRIGPFSASKAAS